MDDQSLRAISERCEAIQRESGDILQRPRDLATFVYFLVRGRVKQSLVDFQGNVLMERIQSAGAQFNALAAAACEPVPVQLEVIEPAILLRFEYKELFELTKSLDAFRQNLTRLIAESVGNALTGDRRQKPPTIISLIHPTTATRPIARPLIERLHALGPSVGVVYDAGSWSPIEGVRAFPLNQRGGTASDSEVRQFVDSIPGKKLIVLDFSTEIEQKRMFDTFELSEKIFWCVTEDSWRESIQTLSEILNRSSSWRDKVNLVWLLPGDALRGPLAPELRSLAARDFKLSLDPPPKQRGILLQRGLERLIHEIRGVRIGLALGGGAARGMAHLGVLKALEDNGIVIDRIAGTSAGAMTGILYGSGMDPRDCVDCFVRELTPPWLFRQFAKGGYWDLLYKYRMGKFDPLLRKYLLDSRLEQLLIPVQSVTVDLICGVPVVRDIGDTVHSILESINLPVLSKPINRDGRALVDGGIVNNVPANVLATEGCNFVIAVSVTAKIKQEFAKNGPGLPTAKMKPASILETILRTYVVQNVNMNSVGVQPADFVIQPDVNHFDITEFSRAGEMADIGTQCALESMPALQQALSQIDDRLFPT